MTKMTPELIYLFKIKFFSKKNLTSSFAIKGIYEK